MTISSDKCVIKGNHLQSFIFTIQHTIQQRYQDGYKVDTIVFRGKNESSNHLVEIYFAEK